MSKPWLGKHLSETHKAHIRAAILSLPSRGRPKGIPSHRKGTKIDKAKYPRWGNYKKPTAATRARMRAARLGVEPWNKGKRGLYTHSAETKEKIAASCRKVLNTPTIREKLVEYQNRQSTKLARLERIKSQNSFDTDIELKLQELLNVLNVAYRKQERIADITVADFYLPYHDLYIFCDGDYWHSMPHVQAKDARQNRLMLDRGIKFMRFRGKEILKMPELVKVALTSQLSLK